MNYKLVAITFKTINEAYSFIAQEQYNWMQVNSASYKIIRNENTTVITVVFAKSVGRTSQTLSEFSSNYLKIIKAKTKQECLKLIFEKYYPYPKIKNSTEMVELRVPTSEKKVKDFLRDKVDDLAYKIPDGIEKDDWHTSLFMIKVSMETQGVKFWRAATSVIKWLEEQNHLQVA